MALACGGTDTEPTLERGNGRESAGALQSLGTPQSPGASPSSGAPVGGPEGVATVALGETLTLTTSMIGEDTQVELTVSDLEIRDSDESGFSEPELGQFVVVTVTGVGVSGSYYLTSSDFRLIASDGTVHDSTYASFDPRLTGTTLNAGQRTSGRVAFDTTVGAESGGRIGVQGFLTNEEVGYWTL